MLERRAMMQQAISHLADLRLGYHFRGKIKEAAEGGAKVLQVRNVSSESGVTSDLLTQVAIPNAEKHAVKQGEVVFLARGRNRFAFVFDVNDPLPIVPASYFIILTPKQEVVDSGYLAWAINQPVFQSKIESRSTGTSIPQISKTDLQELTINLPPIKTQLKIAALDGLMQQEQTLTRQINLHRAQLLRAASRGETA